MYHEGPPLEHLLHRLAETPRDFLAEPVCGDRGQVLVAAVIRDVLVAKGIPFTIGQLTAFTGRNTTMSREALAIALLLTWMLADPALTPRKEPVVLGSAVLSLLRLDTLQLATSTTAAKLTTDPERREELARLLLARLDLRPAGESLEQAQDRLTSISSLERTRVLEASRKAEERARAIREALAKKAADESADKWSRE